MSIGEEDKRNNKKEKGNQYCDHNMAGDHNTGTVVILIWVMIQLCITNAVMSRTCI